MKLVGRFPRMRPFLMIAQQRSFLIIFVLSFSALKRCACTGFGAVGLAEKGARVNL